MSAGSFNPDLSRLCWTKDSIFRVAQQHADQALAASFQGDDVLAVGEDDARDGDLVHRADGLADHRKGVVVADLSSGST